MSELSKADLTFKEFEHNFIWNILPNKGRYLRTGQVLMIYLSKMNKRLYDLITGTEHDCFYVDKKAPKTFEFIKNNWDVK